MSLNKSMYSVHLEPGGALYESHISSSNMRKKTMGPPERVGVMKEDNR